MNSMDIKNKALQVVVAGLKYKPERITVTTDIEGKRWPEIKLQYRWEGKLGSLGTYIKAVAQDLDRFKIIVADVHVPNLSRGVSTTFGTTDIDARWICFLDFTLDSHTRIDAVQAAMKRADDERNGRA
jgi:hypothetical protein